MPRAYGTFINKPLCSSKTDSVPLTFQTFRVVHLFRLICLGNEVGILLSFGWRRGIGPISDCWYVDDTNYFFLLNRDSVSRMNLNVLRACLIISRRRFYNYQNSGSERILAR